MALKGLQLVKYLHSAIQTIVNRENACAHIFVDHDAS